jgi:flagellar hook-length control protein FliK
VEDIAMAGGIGVPERKAVESGFADQAAGAAALATPRAEAGGIPQAEGVPAAFERIAQEIPLAAPGAPRELELNLQTEQLGKVRVRIEQTAGGLVRVELRASSAEAARVLQGGLAEFRDSLERLRVPVDIPAVAVGLGAGFAGQQQERPSHRFFEREAPPPGRVSGAGSSTGGTAFRSPRQIGLVDVLA